MSAFTRMMEDYDYHQHTGELPEYFGGGSGDNRGCGFGCFVAIILFAGVIYATCSSDKKEEAKEAPKPEFVTVPTYQYQTPYYPPESSAPSSASTKEQTEQSKVEEPKQQQELSQPQPVKPIKISRYYKEGYDKGYDDGEDDAVMDNGFGGQFDDECRYEGWKKDEYEQGYEEGYEAGYYDNKETDE